MQPATASTVCAEISMGVLVTGACCTTSTSPRLCPSCEIGNQIGPRDLPRLKAAQSASNDRRLCHQWPKAERLNPSKSEPAADRGGAFEQRVHSANYYVVYPRNTPENHPPTEGCMINSKQHGVHNSGPWDPWQASDKKKNPGAPAGGVGCRIQEPGIHGYRWWKTADFSYSAGTAHGAPPEVAVALTAASTAP